MLSSNSSQSTERSGHGHNCAYRKSIGKPLQDSKRPPLLNFRGGHSSQTINPFKRPGPQYAAMQAPIPIDGRCLCISRGRYGDGSGDLSENNGNAGKRDSLKAPSHTSRCQRNRPIFPTKSHRYFILVNVLRMRNCSNRFKLSWTVLSNVGKPNRVRCSAWVRGIDTENEERTTWQARYKLTYGGQKSLGRKRTIAGNIFHYSAFSRGHERGIDLLPQQPRTSEFGSGDRVLSVGGITPSDSSRNSRLFSFEKYSR